MLNHISIMGRLTAEPELRTTSTGITFCRLVIANESDYQSKDGERPVNFVPVTAWRGTAEFITRNFTKGKLIIIDGTLRINSYDKNGEMRFLSSIEANRVYFAGDKKAVQAVDNPPESELPQGQGNYTDFDLSDYEEILSGNDVPF